MAKVSNHRTTKVNPWGLDAIVTRNQQWNYDGHTYFSAPFETAGGLQHSFPGFSGQAVAIRRAEAAGSDEEESSGCGRRPPQYRSAVIVEPWWSIRGSFAR